MSIVTLLDNGIGGSPSAWRKVADGSSESICLSYGSLDGGQISIELKSGDNINLGTPIGTLGNPVGEVGEERTIRIVGPAVYRVRRKGSLSVGAVVLYDDAYNALAKTPGTILVFDPSDLTTLFQDSAGTIPVTGMEQPVGLMLDKSKGLVRGADSRDTGAPSAFGTPPSAATYNAAGEGTASRTDGSNFSYVTFTGVTIGKSYEITVRNSGGSNLSVRTSSIGTVLFTVPAGATLTGRVVPAGLGALSVAPDTNGSSISFTVLSVRELPGNHATQATAASRPILTARKNLLLNTRFTNGVGGTLNAGAVQPDYWSFGFVALGGQMSFPDNSVTFVATTNTQRPFLQQVPTVAANSLYLLTTTVLDFSGPVKVEDCANWAGFPAGATVAKWMKNGVNAPINSSVAVGDVVTCVLSVGATAGPAQARIGLGASTPGVIGSLTLTTPQLELVSPTSVSPTRYQLVKTATDYDYVGFPVGLRCDGVDDGMVTPNSDFTGTDKMFVCAGVRKLSDAAVGVIVELSANQSLNAGAMNLITGPTAGTYQATSRGTSGVSAQTPSLFPAPTSNVVSAILSIGEDIARVRVDGNSWANNGDQGTGNYGNYPLYLFRRGSSSLPFNGIFYGLVLGGAAYSAATIAAVEQEMLGKVAS